MAASQGQFDIRNPAVFLRIALGVLYLPHIAFKLMDMNGAAGFFGKAGFQPAMFFVVLAIVMESIAAIGLTFNILVKWAGLISAGVMAVAVFAIFMVKGAGWLWNLGGVEYLVFWAVASFVLALQAWMAELREYGRLSILMPSAKA